MGWLNKPLLGIDLGSRTLKGIRLKKKKKRIVLDNYFFLDLEQTANSFSPKSGVAESLAAGIELNNLQKSSFSLSIPDRDVMHIDLNLPKLKPTELRTAIGHELSEHTGIPVDELAFDYVLSEAESTGNVNVRAYGTQKRLVEDLVAKLAHASLRPVHVEPDTFAICAMLEFNGYLHPNLTYVIFDLGDNHLTASLYSNGELRLTKSSAVGSGQINKLLMEKLGLSHAEAERRKQKYDFNSNDRGEHQVEQLIDEVYASIFSDAKSALELFNQNLADSTKIDEIILVGGGSQTRNFERVFEVFFATKTTVANPFRNIDIFDPRSSKSKGKSQEIASLAPFMAAAVGSALLGMGLGKSGK